MSAAPDVAALCEAWWRPVYGYIQRRGHTPEDAEDLTQEFFARCIEKNYLGGVRSDRGTPGSFLFGCVRHFLCSEWDRARAEKRGGKAVLVSIDDPDRDPRDEPSHRITPETVYEARWAHSVLDRTRGRLRREFHARGQLLRFQWFEQFLMDGQERGAYAGVARELGISETAVKVGVHRLRQRYGSLLKEDLINRGPLPQFLRGN